MWTAPLRRHCSQSMCRSRLCCALSQARAESSGSRPISLFFSTDQSQTFLQFGSGLFLHITLQPTTRWCLKTYLSLGSTCTNAKVNAYSEIWILLQPLVTFRLIEQQSQTFWLFHADLKHLLRLKCTNRHLSVLLLPTGMEQTWNRVSLICLFCLWCRAKKTFFHAHAAETRPGCDHLAQTTKLLLLFKHFTLLRLE